MHHSYSNSDCLFFFLLSLSNSFKVTGHTVLPRGVCVMGVNKALTSPEHSSSSRSSSGNNYSAVAEPAHPITDQQGETIHHNITGHSIVLSLYFYIYGLLLLHVYNFSWNSVLYIETLTDCNVTQTAAPGCEIPQGHRVGFLTASSLKYLLSAVMAKTPLTVMHIFTDVLLSGRGRAASQRHRRQQRACHPQHHR